MSCPQKYPGITACQCCTVGPIVRTLENLRVRGDQVPAFERIAHNKRRAIIGLDYVQAGIIKNSCNWSEKR